VLSPFSFVPAVRRHLSLLESVTPVTYHLDEEGWLASRHGTSCALAGRGPFRGRSIVGSIPQQTPTGSYLSPRRPRGARQGVRPDAGWALDRRRRVFPRLPASTVVRVPGTRPGHRGPECLTFLPRRSVQRAADCPSSSLSWIRGLGGAAGLLVRRCPGKARGYLRTPYLSVGPRPVQLALAPNLLQRRAAGRFRRAIHEKRFALAKLASLRNPRGTVP